MRKGLIIVGVCQLVILGLLVRSVWTLLLLLVVDGHQEAITRAELPAPNSAAINDRPQLIPKIIHQTYRNETIPTRWQDAQKSCIELHKDWEYKVCVLELRFA
jgi:inositol phosphorylceramide mannosyltransferase catalytic subunit